MPISRFLMEIRSRLIKHQRRKVLEQSHSTSTGSRKTPANPNYFSDGTCIIGIITCSCNSWGRSMEIQDMSSNPIFLGSYTSVFGEKGNTSVYSEGKSVTSIRSRIRPVVWMLFAVFFSSPVSPVDMSAFSDPREKKIKKKEKKPHLYPMGTSLILSSDVWLLICTFHTPRSKCLSDTK